MNMIRTIVPIEKLKHGDTVEIDGVFHTVSRDDLRYCSFVGYTFRGQAYPKTVTKVVFKVPIANGGYRYA